MQSQQLIRLSLPGRDLESKSLICSDMTKKFCCSLAQVKGKEETEAVKIINTDFVPSLLQKTFYLRLVRVLADMANISSSSYIAKLYI